MMEEETIQNSRCPYLSHQFTKIFDEYTVKNLTKARTKGQYWYVICNLCNMAKCDFLTLSVSHINAYFSHITPDTPLKSTNYDLTVLRAISRYLDENAEQYQLSPRYLSLFSELKVEFPNMQFRAEDLPSLSDVDTILAYFKDQGDMVGFIACSMVLRAAFTTTEIVKLNREMLFQDLNGNYGARLPISSHAYRFVKIPDDIATLIIQYTSQRTDNNPSLLLNKKGQTVSARALQNRLHDACTQCHIPLFTYNDLRTLSQAIMIKDGAPVDKIAKQTNVKKTDWFFRYNRVVNELENAAVDYSHIKIAW